MTSDHTRNPCITVLITMSQLSITTVYPLERLLTALILMSDVISTTAYKVLPRTYSE
jgi:hypothetical protein